METLRLQSACTTKQKTKLLWVSLADRPEWKIGNNYGTCPCASPESVAGNASSLLEDLIMAQLPKGHDAESVIFRRKLV